MIDFDDISEVEVAATNTLTRTAVVYDPSSYECTDWEYEPDEGRSVPTRYVEHGDLERAYRNDYRTAGECLKACCEVLAELLEENKPVIAGINLRDLYHDCNAWEEIELIIEN